MSSEGGPSSWTPTAEIGVLPSVVESRQSSSTRTVVGEYRSLFAPYRQHVPLPYRPFLQPAANKKRRLLDPKVKTPKLWRHSFVFLQRKDAVFVPDSRERALLLSAGYGKKKLEFNADGRVGHIHEVLCRACTGLAQAGYELCCSGQSSYGARLLEVIEPPRKGFNVEFLRSWLNQAKCYVRLVQNDLLDKDEISSDSVRIVKSLLDNNSV